MRSPSRRKLLCQKWERIKFSCINQEKPEPVEVTTGIRTDAEVQIVRGLQVGDTILTSGTLQLRLGLPVTLDNID